MPKNIRLSGTIDDNDSRDLRKIRAKLLYHLFSAGFNIYNGNGDQDVSLWNIQKKIVEADGFVFMPGAKFDDMLKASSIFVGYQTGDGDLNGKPSVMLNPRGSWNRWLAVIDHLHKMGTVSQDRKKILNIVERPKQVVDALLEQTVLIEKVRTCYGGIPPKKSIKGDERKKKPEHAVCVFCSASTKNEEFLSAGYNLGVEIAKLGWGCVSGAGRTGIMGEVVRGAFENDGWTGGSNIPHIIELEGLPDGMNAFWPTSDIYKRMEIMIQQSDAFVIMPGGMGSVQEMLVLLDLIQKKDELMKNKPVILVNYKIPDPETDSTIGFWDPLIDLTKRYGVDKSYTVTDSVKDTIKLLKSIK